jgi:hypothetical protein
VRRPLAPVLAFIVCATAVSACEALSGLDGIAEVACAPSCGEYPAASDGEVEGGGEGGAFDRTEASPPLEAALSDAGDEPGMADQVASDGSMDTGAFETGLGDAPAETSTPGADAGPDASAEAGPCGTVFFSDPFDGNAHGWTLDATWSIASTCASPPAPQKGNPDPTVDHTTGNAGGVAGAYVCGNNPTGATAVARYATSPAVDVSSAPAVVLTFYRWLNSDAVDYMTSTVDVYDGTSWVNLYTNPTGSGNTVTDAAWTRETYDVTAYKNATLKVRFGYAIVGAGVYEMSCWNVDDVALSTVACP